VHVSLFNNNVVKRIAQPLNAIVGGFYGQRFDTMWHTFGRDSVTTLSRNLRCYTEFDCLCPLHMHLRNLALEPKGSFPFPILFIPEYIVLCLKINY
jgi:hypothetical protein